MTDILGTSWHGICVHRTHERNHSWGGLESKPLDDMAQGGGDGKQSGLFAAHGTGWSAAEVPWFEAEDEMAGLNITSPKGAATDKMFHSIMMLSGPFCSIHPYQSIILLSGPGTQKLSVDQKSCVRCIHVQPHTHKMRIRTHANTHALQRTH